MKAPATKVQHVVEDMVLPQNKAPEWHSIRKELYSAVNKPVLGKCLFRSGECEASPIKSHLLSRQWLRHIADETNHVLSFEFSTANLTRAAARFQPEPIGINEATVFPGFCNSHDTELFSCLEKEEFSATRNQILALAYRSVSNHVCRKHQMVGCNLQRALSIENHPLAPLVMGEYQRLLVLMKKKLRLEELMSSQSDGLETFAVFFHRKPTVFVAATFLPFVTFTGRLLDGSRHDWLTFSVLPFCKGGCALFSWEQSASKNTSLLVKSLNALPSELVTQAILNLICEVSEDFVLSPTWWSGLGEMRQRELLRRYARTFVENKPPPAPTIIPSKPVWADWEVYRKEFIR